MNNELTLTRRGRGVRLQPLIEPVEYGLEPKLAVLRLQNPVSFVRVIEQLRRDALALQGREELQPFADRHAVIQFAVNDQRRGLEIFGAQVRRPLRVKLRVVPWRAFELPVGEP